MTFPRDGRIKKLSEALEESRSDASLFRAALTQKLADSTKLDMAEYERGLAETELVKSRDQVRLLLADRLIKHGAFEVSFDEQETAFRHADQVQILPDSEAKVTRFSLLEGVALRPLPAKPLVVVPAPGMPLGSEPATGTDEPTTGPGTALHAVVDPDESKAEPEPS